ncbi:glycosyltransferase [Micromonospora sp. NBS 11-29]|uniref:glycosyltransferase n=1 Tax=Micromonospora sp. NBS 11-29 TaxID=1960879 RepID=UPI000B786321|nr:glycosyltransferase [Micromonospora sp. NBS 11-29]
MRILFGAAPGPGHVLPLLPLADAAVAAGHDAAFLTADSMTPYLGGRRLLPAGPSVEELIVVNLKRAGSARTLGPGAAELLAGTRVDLTWDEALRQAQRHEPDLIVSEWFDFVAPLLAARLGVPWAAYASSGPWPAEFADPARERTRGQHASRSLTPRARIALLDPFPESLRLPTDTAPEPGRITVRPGGVTVEVTAQPSRPVPPRVPGLPRALVTLGTSVANPSLVADLARSVDDAGFDVLVTAGPDQVRPGPRVHPVGFAPLPELLPGVDVVIGSAGSGTLLATLAAGVPSVLMPVFADQPPNAARAVHRGAARMIDDPNDVGVAARRVVDDPTYRQAAREVAQEAAAMNSPRRALTELLTSCR